jgi:hypothetical protein
MTRGMSDYDRRIGDRVDTAAIPVLWRTPAPGEKRRSLGRRARKPESALLRDISVSGLQIRALAADDLGVGVKVHLEVDGVAGWGTIRRMAAVPGTRFCDYGLELSTRATDLVQMVHDRVAATRPSEIDWR